MLLVSQPSKQPEREGREESPPGFLPPPFLRLFLLGVAVWRRWIWEPGQKRSIPVVALWAIHGSMVVEEEVVSYYNITAAVFIWSKEFSAYFFGIRYV